MFSRGYYQENINIFNEKLTNRLFSLQCDVENFIILLKYRQTKFDLKLAKNCFFSLQYHIKNFIFTYSYCIRKFHIYAKIRICRKTLLFYILLWTKVQKIWCYLETEAYKNQQKDYLFCPFQKCLWDENSFFHAVTGSNGVKFFNHIMIYSLCNFIFFLY